MRHVNITLRMVCTGKNWEWICPVCDAWDTVLGTDPDTPPYELTCPRCDLKVYTEDVDDILAESPEGDSAEYLVIGYYEEPTGRLGLTLRT